MSRLASMHWRPRLRSGHRLAPAENGGWQIRWDFDEIAFLDGAAWQKVLPWLVPLLDGEHTLEELLRTAAASNLRGEFTEVLETLEAQRFLAESSLPEASDLPDWRPALEALGQDPNVALERIERRSVRVSGNSLLADEIATVISAQGLRVRRPVLSETVPVDAGPGEAGPVEAIDKNGNVDADFRVVVETDFGTAALTGMNERALAVRQPWMIVSAWNTRALVGPILIPGTTACYDCYRQRLKSHRRYQAAWQAFDEWRQSDSMPAAPEPILPAIARMVAAWTAMEVFAYLSESLPPRTLGRVLVCYPLEARTAIENVLRIPWCPTCSRVQH